VTLDLPGPPAKVIPFDVNGDGLTDLVVVVAYTEIEEIGEDRVENLVQISQVIPALFDRREVRLYLARADGTYEFAGPPLPLPQSVLHLEPGPAAWGLVALTDEGLSRLRFETGTLRLEPVVDDEPILAGSGSFFASLELVHDLDGDGVVDVLLPSKQGPSIYLGGDSGLAKTAVERIEVPEASEGAENFSTRWYPLPEVREINGDGLPDLLFRGLTGAYGSDRLHLFVGAGGGRFRPLRDEPLDCHDTRTDLRMAVDDPALYPWPDNLAALRDLDGDGRAEAVLITERSRGDGMRKEMKDAKKPRQEVGLHRLREDLTIDREPYQRMEVVGHTFSLDDDDAGNVLPVGLEQFVALDGDGREDLITITLDFSIFQVLKILATKKIGVRIHFHVYAQQVDGSFDEVPDLDLDEKLKFDLNNLALGRFAQFAGDFDGDGRQDFVHLGRGRMVTIHRGQPGCRYPRDPDLAVELDQEPASLDLIKIEDLDGDGRSDLRITRPLTIDDPDITAPVRVDLYLSGGES
jgi:hypothetical protein